MISFVTIDAASAGFSNDYFYEIDCPVPGLLRGFNIEFKDDGGSVSYSDIVFLLLDISSSQKELDREINKFSVKGLKPTGRIVFRGYFHSYFDRSDRKWYLESSDPLEVKRRCQLK